ncbi:MAG: hypothetical protein ACI4WH_06385 [Oscillospiraceae bacterium]
MIDDYFLKYEYRFGATSNFDLGYDIFFYQDSFSITKIHLMEDFSPKYHTLDKSKFDILKSYLRNFHCPQDLNTIGICDGYSSYIEIKENNQIKRFGGYNPQNENYLQLEKLIQSIVGEIA